MIDVSPLGALMALEDICLLVEVTLYEVFIYILTVSCKYLKIELFLEIL